MGSARGWENWLREYRQLVEKASKGSESIPSTDANRLNYLRNLLEAGLGTKTTLSEDNRRLELRIPAKIPVSMESEGKTFRGHTLNISIWGMFVAVEEPPDTGTKVEVHLDTDEQSTNFQAEVRWVIKVPQGAMPAGVGLRLVPQAPEIHLPYRELCHQRLRESIVKNVR